jgi:cytochrome c-type biogenesis protein CcmF
MILHPPMLFVGYAGFTVPFAILVGALVTGRADDAWVGATRRWLLVSWLFLSVGILLGAQWAYEELGWGGYWAWDPVENASLLPWLTGTAVLHTVGMQRFAGAFKKTNALLLAGTFILCIFATYLTRSGVIQSVHAFGESLIGTFFLVFLIITTFGSIALLVWRRKLLKSASLEKLGVKGQAFAIAVVLLVVMTIITAVGTIFPLISAVVTKPINVGPEFYNTVVGPIGMLLLAVMAAGPLLRSEADGANRLKRGALIPGAVAAIVVIVCIVMGITLTWALAAAAITAFAVLAVLADLIHRYRVEAGRDRSVTLLRLIDASHYRYGGQLVHMGMIMILVGVIGSSLFNQRDTFKLRAGQIGHIGRYTLKFNGLAEQREGNYTAVAAHVDVFDASSRRSYTLHPQMRFYDKAKDSHSEVALHSTLGEDLYLTIAGWDDGGKLVALQAIVNPLIGWIWIGGITLVVGGVFSLLPRLARQRKPVTVAGSAPAPGSDSPSPTKLAEVSR